MGPTLCALQSSRGGRHRQIIPQVDVLLRQGQEQGTGALSPAVGQGVGKARRRGGCSAGREGSMSRGQVVDGDHSGSAWNAGRAKGELGVRQEERREKEGLGHTGLWWGLGLIPKATTHKRKPRERG